MNVLFLATYGDFLATFEYSNIQLWQKLGCTVHCAANFQEEKYNLKLEKLDNIGVIKHNIIFERSPIKIKNFFSYKELVNLIKNEKIGIIDTHNAVISAFARIAADRCKVKKVIYTPHSFFFFKGCKIKNKLIYKTIESLLARKTDLLVTINQEDYNSAQKMHLRGKAIYVPGVGIDTGKIMKIPNNRKKYCKELNMSENSTIFISVGELINRKNHITAIKAFAEANLPNSYYLICGIGKLESELKLLIEQLKAEDRIKLLGYRLDAKEIMKSSDVFIFPSFQEGLPVALMEAMACGLPCIASNIRGNVDLITDEENGLLFNPTDTSQLSNIIKSKKIFEKYANVNLEKVKKFDIGNVKNIMYKEYKEILEK